MAAVRNSGWCFPNYFPISDKKLRHYCFKYLDNVSNVDVDTNSERSLDSLLVQVVDLSDFSISESHCKTKCWQWKKKEDMQIGRTVWLDSSNDIAKL